MITQCFSVCGGGTLVNVGYDSGFPVYFSFQVIHTVILCDHTVFFCVEGDPAKRGVMTVVFQYFFEVK